MDPSVQKYIDINTKLLDAFDKLLASGDWEASLYLKATKKRILKLREQTEALLKEAQVIQAGGSEEQEGVGKKLAAGQRKVYISLYQAEPDNLSKWKNILKSLPMLSISRPIYAEETHVHSMIRNKDAPQKEAYAVLLVDESDIIHAYHGKALADKLGNELLTLKQRAVRLDHIIEFVHGAKHYLYKGNELILQKG